MPEERAMSRNGDDSHHEISAFYKEEFLKHKARLEMQKEFYSDNALSDIETALDKIIKDMDTICRLEQFSQLASQLLERIDIITNLSGSPSKYSKRIH
jgi:hypothetical protein